MLSERRYRSRVVTKPAGAALIGLSTLGDPVEGCVGETVSATAQFEHLIGEYASLMAAAIRKICGRRNHSLIPDVQQEVYLALWKRVQGGNEITYPVSYLYKMALTTALAVIRKNTRETPASDDRIELMAPTADGLLPAERSRLLSEVLGLLDNEHQRAMRAYLAGFNHQEVAGLYDWSESVARHRIYRGIETLKRKMSEGDERRAASG